MINIDEVLSQIKQLIMQNSDFTVRLSGLKRNGKFQLFAAHFHAGWSIERIKDAIYNTMYAHDDCSFDTLEVY